MPAGGRQALAGSRDRRGRGDDTVFVHTAGGEFRPALKTRTRIARTAIQRELYAGPGSGARKTLLQAGSSTPGWRGSAGAACTGLAAVSVVFPVVRFAAFFAFFPAAFLGSASIV